MPLALSDRPRAWDQIVGQPRAVEVLRSILTKGRFSPKGIILEGPSGVGKTTTAYVTARTLMCTGDSPLGCGSCPSCQTFDASPDHPEHHPDVTMVDGASYSGVEAARRIVDAAMDLPVMGKARVVIVDEAHRLSQEAWDVYLAPMENQALRCVFLFCTTAPHRIPKTIKGRCCRVPFTKVSTDAIAGLLVVIATRHEIAFEIDGVKAIARASKGHVRDAVQMLDKVASVGKVTRDLVTSTIDLALPDMAMSVLIKIATARLVDACHDLDAICRGYGSGKAVEEVFAAFGRAMFGDPEATEDEALRYQTLKRHFPDPAAVTGTLLKWSATDRIPSDALPLFAHEMAQHVDTERTERPKSQPAEPLPPRASTTPQGENVTRSAATLSATEVAQALTGRVVR